MAWLYSQQIKGLPRLLLSHCSISATGGYMRLSMSLVSGKLRSQKMPS